MRDSFANGLLWADDPTRPHSAGMCLALASTGLIADAVRKLIARTWFASAAT